MIKSIRIENFQSIKKADIICGMFTCITGPSDSGKSAFIRALHACITARRGFDFATFGEDNVNIGVAFADRSTIVWRRTKSTGKYTLRDGKEIKEFTKYGHSCPEEVVSLARLGNIAIDEQISFNPNFSSQFDALFLISERGSVIAKILSTVTNANNLLLAVREANLVAGKKATELKIYEEQLLELNEQIQDFDWLDTTGEQLTILKARIETAKQKRKLLDNLLESEHKLRSIQKKKLDNNVLLKSIQNVIDLCDKALVCDEKAKMLAAYKRLYINARAAINRLTFTQDALDSTISKIMVIEQGDAKYDRLTVLKKFQQLEKCVVEKNILYKDAKNDSRIIGTELGHIMDELAEFETCPLCGKELGAKNVN